MKRNPPERDEMSVMESTELELRAEIERLKAQLAERAAGAHGTHSRPGSARPSRAAMASLALLALVLIVVGFFAGYLPRQRREALLAREAKADAAALPTVNVATVERSGSRSELVLPANIQAVTEAPVLARASGYLKRRLVDIGDRVTEGQLLGEIEAPEVDQQVKEAKATREQAESSLEQAMANLQQGKANAELARANAERWQNLVVRGVVSKQENDTYQAQYQSQIASVQALEKAVSAARNNVGAVEANVARLIEMQGYEKVKAPFAGVITVRNVDVGALINAGTTLLFRIAQTDRLRTYVNLPQSDAASVRVGQQAVLTIPDLPQRKFPGIVTRTANALDPSTRTLLTEVQAANPEGLLMPGMYADVDLSTPRRDPPLLIPGDTLVVRSDGPQVAIVMPDNTVHFQRIQIGRDFGDKLEVLSGLQPGQQIIVNPGDSVREHAKVNPVSLQEKGGKKP